MTTSSRSGHAVAVSYRPLREYMPRFVYQPVTSLSLPLGTEIAVFPIECSVNVDPIWSTQCSSVTPPFTCRNAWLRPRASRHCFTFRRVDWLAGRALFLPPYRRLDVHANGITGHIFRTRRNSFTTRLERQRNSDTSRPTLSYPTTIMNTCVSTLLVVLVCLEYSSVKASTTMFTSLLTHVHSMTEKDELTRLEMKAIVDDLTLRFNKTNSASVSRSGVLHH